MNCICGIDKEKQIFDVACDFNYNFDQKWVKRWRVTDRETYPETVRLPCTEWEPACQRAILNNCGRFIVFWAICSSLSTRHRRLTSPRGQKSLEILPCSSHDVINFNSAACCCRCCCSAPTSMSPARVIRLNRTHRRCIITHRVSRASVAYVQQSVSVLAGACDVGFLSRSIETSLSRRWRFSPGCWGRPNAPILWGEPEGSWWNFRRRFPCRQSGRPPAGGSTVRRSFKKIELCTKRRSVIRFDIL